MTDSLLFASSANWQQCLTDYLAALLAKSGSEATLSNYRSTLYAFFGGSPDKLPDAYTRQEVEAFVHGPSRVKGQQEKAVGAGTMNQRQSVLSSFYRYAGGYTVLGEDGRIVPLLERVAPTTGMSYRRVRRRHRVLSAEELAKLFAVIPTDTVFGLRDRALFLCYFWCARRRMEILRLTWGDIEEAVIVDPDGTRRTGWVYRFRGKGHAREEDSAELPGPAKRAIDAYLRAAGRLETMQPDDALFPALRVGPYGKQPDRRRPMRGQTVHAALKRYCQLAGIAPCSIHSLRHAAARARYAAGEDVRSIQTLLRHRSLATTDLYLSVLAGTADPFAQKLEAKYGGL